MKVILLTNGGATFVDDSDYEELGAFNWQLSPQGYAYRCSSRGKRRVLLMHRVITGARKGQIVDHISRFKLDNQRANLRKVTASENALNSKLSSKNTSGFRNVTFRKDTGKWQAGMMRNRRYVNVGSFATVQLAHKAIQIFIKTKGAE